MVTSLQRLNRTLPDSRLLEGLLVRWICPEEEGKVHGASAKQSLEAD